MLIINDLFSEKPGDLWDMFWHHHWCLRNDLGPLTITLFLKNGDAQKDAESSYGHFPLFK